MLIAQISDPHIRPPGALYKGAVDTNAMFPPVLRQLNAMRPRPDLVLLTGDLADNAAPEELRHAADMLRALELPLLVLPGNHDDREAFRATFPGLPPAGPLHVVVDGPLRVIGLDVTVPGQPHGEFDAAAETWLESAMAGAAGAPVLLAMHQPPLALHIPYMDRSLCRGGDRLAALLARHPNVVRVACGHVHRTVFAPFAGTLLCTAPSTSVAIALRLWPEAEPATLIEPPGFLLHEWDGTRLATHLVPVGTFGGAAGFT